MEALFPPPAMEHRPSPVVDLSDKDTRERLSASALKAAFAIFDKWGLAAEQGRSLLGGMSNGRYYALRKAPDALLDQDRLQRASLLVGIFKALNILYSENLADAWPGLANRNRIFQGESPVRYMIRGGIPAMQTVRRLLDARRGGA